MGYFLSPFRACRAAKYRNPPVPPWRTPDWRGLAIGLALAARRGPGPYSTDAS
jgi:hypothetical protein